MLGIARAATSLIVSRRVIQLVSSYMSSPTRLPSPPAKRFKSGSSDPMVSVEEAPVKALFVPPQPQLESASASASEAGPSKSTVKPQQKSANGNVKGGKGKQKKRKLIVPDPYSAGDVLWHDIQDFLGKEYVNKVLERKDKSEWDAPEDLEIQSIVELRVGAFTVSGQFKGEFAVW